MNEKEMTGKSRRSCRWLAGALVWVVGVTGSAQAQLAKNLPESPAPVQNAVATSDSPGGVVQAGCSSCSSGVFGPRATDLGPAGGVVDGGCGGSCYPGHAPCDCCCDSTSGVGRFFCGFYQCVCCPDPCYEPHWVAAADSAFFLDAARPVTQMRLRYEQAWDMPFPDKGEFFLARSDGKGLGPKTPASSLNYRELSLYNEVAVDRFSASIEMPYLSISPDTTGGASGLADMTIGTKSLLLDCELMQFSFGFKTFLPVGDVGKGLGTGHVSLEPELLTTVKLAPKTYLQTELAYRFPLGGDATFSGPVFMYHASINQVLWCCGQGVQLIGNLELNGYEFMGGAFSQPDGAGGAIIGSAKDVGDVLSIGPGLRLVLCDKIDFGVGTAFNLTNDSVGNQIVRAEFRWRF